MNDEREVEVLVVGAGPAGIGAAVEARRAGLRVLIIDENEAAGGQIHRQLVGRPRRAGPRAPSAEARKLLGELWESGVDFMGGATAWAAFEPWTLEVIRAGQNVRIRFRSLVVATGAQDRPFPIPGWTLPGVFTAGGAQALLKSQGVLPGKRILMAGTGPLQLVVASQFARSGAGVVAVAEAVGMASTLRWSHRLLGGGRLLLDGLCYRLDVARAGIPWLAPMVLVGVDGKDQVEQATVAALGPGWRPLPGTERTFEVDTVCIGYGLVPSTELVRALGCEVHFDPALGGWVPRRNEDGETSVEGVFAVGDGADIAGARVALDEGRLAGRSIAARLGSGGGGDAGDRKTHALRRRLRRRRRFAETVREIYRIPEDVFAHPDGDTVVCRCEDVRARRVRTTILAGAVDLTTIKARTRLGMGPCQGRNCAAAAWAMLCAHSRARMEFPEPLPVREPIRPIPISALVRNPPSERAHSSQPGTLPPRQEPTRST